MSRRTRVGVVGLGVMGSAISEHLVAAGGFDVLGHDLDRQRLDRLAEVGGTPLDDVGGLAAASDVVLTSLPSAAAFRAVVEQVARTARPGTDLVDTSTLDLGTKTTAADALRAAGIGMLDCPLSGTGQQARDGDLVAFVSGDPATVARCEHVVAGFTRARYDLGALGNGTRMKLVANLLVAVHNVAAAEALVLAEQLGLAADDVLEAVGDGAGASRMLAVRGPLMAAGSYEPATMRMDVFDKDLGIIRAAVDESGCRTPLFDSAVGVYAEGLAAGLHASDTAVVHEVLRGAGADRPAEPAGATSGRRPPSGGTERLEHE